MTNRKGFTLIELMVVVFIVGILAAVAIPIMRGRIDAAKWSEARSAAGSIRTAARAMIAEKGNAYDFAGNHNGLLSVVGPSLGFDLTDLDGKYFEQNDYGIVFTNAAPNPPTYVITVIADTTGKPEAPTTPGSITLDQDGTFVDL